MDSSNVNKKRELVKQLPSYERKLMKPTINCDVKMPKKMMEALNLYETHCVVFEIKTTTQEKVKAFITEKYNKKLADKFKDEYLY